MQRATFPCMGSPVSALRTLHFLCVYSLRAWLWHAFGVSARCWCRPVSSFSLCARECSVVSPRLPPLSLLTGLLPAFSPGLLSICCSSPWAGPLSPSRARPCPRRLSFPCAPTLVSPRVLLPVCMWACKRRFSRSVGLALLLTPPFLAQDHWTSRSEVK